MAKAPGSQAKESAAPRRRRSGADFPERIRAASIQCIGALGMSKVTHRAIAEQADVPLAATTYHYATKADIIAGASTDLLDQYLTNLRRVRAGAAPRATQISSIRQLVLQILLNASGHRRVETLAWLEIMVEAGRQGRLSGIAQNWFVELDQEWREVNVRFTGRDVPLSVTYEILIGLLYLTRAMGLSEEQVRKLFVDKRPLQLISKLHNPAGAENLPSPKNNKSGRNTRSHS